MRADRLLAILLLLQARGGMSAPELAEQLEVSVRTIFRDLDALSAAGVPVYTDRGAQGGVRLLEGYRTDLTGLSPGEAQALFLLGIPGPLDELGLGSVVGGAERKLLAALPPVARRGAEQTRQRIHVDPAGWDRGPQDIAHLSTVSDAVFRERRLRIVYSRGDSRRVERVVDPLGLALKGGVWYLVAVAEGQLRVYRVSRVRAVGVLDEGLARPRGFDLAEFWSEWAARYESEVTWAEVRVRVSPRFAPQLPWALGEYTRSLLEEALPDAAGWRAITLRFYSLDEARISLLGMGTEVEVLSPHALRTALRRAATALVAHYATTARGPRRVEARTARSSESGPAAHT